MPQIQTGLGGISSDCMWIAAGYCRGIHIALKPLYSLRAPCGHLRMCSCKKYYYSK